MESRDDATEAAIKDAFARLDKLTATVRRGDDARKEAAKVAVELLKLDAKRTEVVRRSPFSHTTLRGIAEAAGIPPDERYVRTQKAAD